MGRVVHGVSCPWGEMSMGRNVRGAKCPWGEMSLGRNVRGANCPWGEMSLGRVVPGVSCPWGELSLGWVVHGASCRGASFDGASCPWGELSWGEWSGNRSRHNRMAIVRSFHHTRTNAGGFLPEWGECDTSHNLRNEVSFCHHWRPERAEHLTNRKQEYKWRRMQNRFWLVRVWTYRFWLVTRREEQIRNRKEGKRKRLLSQTDLFEKKFESVQSGLRVFKGS
jgi:hypothetical protein